MKLDKVIGTLGIVFFFSMWLSCLFIEHHHDCHEDECLRIWYEGRLGICVERAIDNMCNAISFLLPFVVCGGALVLSKNRNASSPFVVMAIVLALAVCIALIDPSKWKFVIAISVPMLILVGASIYDRITSNKNKDKRHL